MIASVLRGETFRGRAYVVNAWYVTAYQPIWNQSHSRVEGVLYVGVKQENVESLRKGIMDIVVGKTGRVFVLGGSGDQKGRLLVNAGNAEESRRPGMAATNPISRRSSTRPSS